jgi:hypothetical protein
VFNRFGKVVRSVQNRAEEGNTNLFDSETKGDPKSLTALWFLALHHDKETISESDNEEVFTNEANKTIKYKTARANKGSHNFNKVQIVQVLHSYQQTSQPLQSPTSPPVTSIAQTSSSTSTAPSHGSNQATNSNVSLQKSMCLISEDFKFFDPANI